MIGDVSLHAYTKAHPAVKASQPLGILILIFLLGCAKIALVFGISKILTDKLTKSVRFSLIFVAFFRNSRKIGRIFWVFDKYLLPLQRN